jgi:hypothetical protein
MSPEHWTVQRAEMEGNSRVDYTVSDRVRLSSSSNFRFTPCLELNIELFASSLNGSLSSSVIVC